MPAAEDNIYCTQLGRYRNKTSGQISHSSIFGGDKWHPSKAALIKGQALSIADNPHDPNHQISLSAKGIATFGTPHRGGHYADTAEAVGSTVRLMLSLASLGEIQLRPESHYVDLLRKDSTALKLMQKWFSTYKEKIWITSFYERLPIVKIPPCLPAFSLVRSISQYHMHQHSDSSTIDRS